MGLSPDGDFKGDAGVPGGLIESPALQCGQGQGLEGPRPDCGTCILEGLDGGLLVSPCGTLSALSILPQNMERGAQTV